ncbi:MAG: sulfite exporter TauE/SafE family protein [Candidatus Omnitrophica bacterium]|nr:sulfite exporter TauE/SafE family protein [Candidatus Omnitrophota bacterium]
MSILTFAALIWIASLFAGFLGALTGLGGGVVIVPLLTLGFGVDIRYAVGASLISVIATSSGAASAYVKEGFSNIRIGMFLEVATTIGALVGAFVAARLSTSVIAIIFGLILIHSSYLTIKRIGKPKLVAKPDPLALRLKLDAAYPVKGGLETYHVQGIPVGFFIMFLAGSISGLLGIGSGAVKVLAMDNVMRLPFKVSTATSNFMIGVTAAAGAGVYLNRGYIDPILAMPVMLGVLAGSLIGARHLFEAKTKNLRIVFSIIILLLAVEMIFSGIKGNI